MSKSNVQTVNSGVSRWRLKREGLCRWLYIGLHRPPIPCSAFAPCYWRVTLRSLQRNLHRFHVIFTARRFTSAVYARYGPASVCLSVCLSQVGVLSKRLKKSSLFFTQGYSAYTLCWKGTRIIPKIKRFLLELCFKLWTEPIFFCFFYRHGTWIVASIVNLVQPTIIASSSHRTSACVYNTYWRRRRAGSSATAEICKPIILEKIKRSACR